VKTIILILILISLGFTKTLYVNGSTGNDATTYANNNSGSPWATIARSMWGSTNRASMVSGEAAQAGDTVIVTAGTYTAAGCSNTNTADRWSPVLVPANSGSSGNEIVFMAETDAAHNSSGLSIIQITTAGGITGGEPTIGVVSGKNYIEFNGFKIYETTSVNQDCGIMTLYQGDNVTVKNCEFVGLTVTYQNNHAGIRIEDINDVTIQNNKVHSVHGNYNDHSDAILLYHSDNVLIEHNELYDCGNGIAVKGSEVWRYEYAITIRYNKIYNILDSGFWLMGADADTRTLPTVDAYQNLITDCFKGITVYGALGGSGGGAYGPQPDSMRIVNNTLDNNQRDVQMKYPAAWGQGNIFHGNICNDAASSHVWTDGAVSDIYYSDGSLLFDYNYIDDYAAWGGEALSGVSKATWQGGTYGQDVNSITDTDPGFVADNSNYRLAGGSGALNVIPDTYFDLDNDASYVDNINAGCYVNATDTMGIVGSISGTPPAADPKKWIEYKSDILKVR